MGQQYDVKYVATYLRKSRGEHESDLDKHRSVLTELCKRNNFKYVEYAEIGTSDSIDMRPQMLKLLKDIESGMYDALCVVDYDRLGRGDLGEQDRIKKAFQKSGTLIITPDKIYDLNNDIDDTYADFKGLFARQEYKMITKRLRQGKMVGSRRGDWTNGKPPFPYEYERYKDKYSKKGIVVNDEQIKLYREIVETALSGATPNTIATTLNQRGILTKKGNHWSGVTIQRLLMDETHLGRIISNKSEGSGHKNKRPNAKKWRLLPRSEWVIVENCHETIKTQEEHDKIAAFIAQRNITPNRALKQAHIFTGLIKCAKCGRFMTFQKKGNEKIYLKPCWYKTHIGEPCTNKGVVVETLEKIILDEIMRFKNEFQLADDTKTNRDNIQSIEKAITEKQDSLVKFRKAIDTINDGYELGDYDRQTWLERKKKWESRINDTNNEIYELKKRLNVEPEVTAQARYANIEFFLANIQRLTSTAERNNLYKSIINYVSWLKDGDDISLAIHYK
jgi:DNA invertase Pin-like site-specific DNA recombinase